MHVWQVSVIPLLLTGKVTCQGLASKTAVPQLKPKTVPFLGLSSFSFSGFGEKNTWQKNPFAEHRLGARQCALLFSSQSIL